jgi:hypothetical protein
MNTRTLRERLRVFASGDFAPEHDDPLFDVTLQVTMRVRARDSIQAEQAPLLLARKAGFFDATIHNVKEDVKE